MNKWKFNTQDRTIGQWNLRFPVRYCQSKSSEVANSQLQNSMSEPNEHGGLS